MIPIADPQIGSAAIERVREVMEDGRLAHGREVREFERRFAEVTGTDHAVATSNGTTALHAALEALGIGEGDAVLTTPLSFVATANAARLCGAEPVFADVDPETYLIDPDRVAETLAEEDVDAMVVVHLYGLPADMDRLLALAEEYDVPVVEDAAQAHGATYRGEPVGSLGDVACFSFYATKNVTTGEGGMVVTDDEAVAERLNRYVDHGRDGDGNHVSLGHNFRLTNLQAAIGLEQLDRLEEFTSARRRNAGALNHLIDDEDVVLPTTPDGRRHVFHQYTVRHPDRDALVEHLREEGVGAGVYYSRAIHQEPTYGGVEVDCPVAERVASEVASLPVHPGVDNDDLQTIAAAVNEFERSRVRQ